MSVLLGTDVPQLQDFVGHALFGDNQQLVAEDALAVTTRVQILRQNEHDAALDQQDKLSGVIPMALDYGDPEVSDVEDGDTSQITTQAETSTMNGDRPSQKEMQSIWMSELDDSLFEPGKIRVRLTRKQKCENCQRYIGAQDKSSPLTDISMDQLKNL